MSLHGWNHHFMRCVWNPRIEGRGPIRSFEADAEMMIALKRSFLRSWIKSPTFWVTGFQNVCVCMLRGCAYSPKNTHNAMHIHICRDRHMTLRDMGGKKVASRTAVACMVHGGLALSEDCTTLGSDHFLLHLHDYVKQYISKILQDIPDGIPLCAVGHIWAAVESRLLLRPLQWHPCYVNAAVSLKLINELLFLLHCHCKEHFTTK